jgi:thymidylate synthase (FAD)
MITIVKPDYTILTPLDGIIEHIERCGRVCYKSEDRITEGSAARFVRNICRRRHESVLEHATITAIVICSRACSHQLVRHRIAAYSQESQRYCDYGKRGLQVICPPSIGLRPRTYESISMPNPYSDSQIYWLKAILASYKSYLQLREEGIAPEDARFVLPNATKTELAITFNLRMWRHVFEERALNKHAQWEIRGIFSGILDELAGGLPAVFGDLGQCDLEM